MSSTTAMINGQTYDWQGTTIKMLGVTVEGITDMQYDLQRETQNNHGRGTKAVSYSMGKEIIPPGSFTIEEVEYRRIVTAAGGDITKVPPFAITVFKKRATKSCTDLLTFVRITGQPQQLNTDTMRNLVVVPFQAGEIAFGPEI